MKTMAIRLEDDLHAQLAILAQLSGGSIAELIRSSIEHYVETKRQDPALAAQADSVLAEIDSEARSRREAIATLFAAPTDPAANGEAAASAKSGGRRSSRSSG
ncbi:MAG: DNA-binding protein [Solirubrobacteraceae bacterium]